MPKPPTTTPATQPPSLHYFCRTFPPRPHPEIHRDHLLDTLERPLTGSTDLLVLEGDEGIGKTTLLSQLARRHGERAIASFHPPMRRYAYDPSALLRDYIEQIQAILDPGKPFSPKDARDGVLQSLVQRLRRTHGTAGYFFLFDGLTDIEDPIMIREVARILPIGHGFPVVVSGEGRLLPPNLRDNPRTQRTLAVHFSFAEVQQYLADLDLSDLDVRQLYMRCGKGLPANLASVRRSLLAGAPLDSMEGTDIQSHFEREWQHAPKDELTGRLLAIVAHSRHRVTVDALSALLSLDVDLVQAQVERIPFLHVDPNAPYVSFVSRAFADFASDQLSDSKETVIKGLVDHLLSPRGKELEEAVDSLPSYLQESGRLDEVISILTPEYFSSVLQRSESFAPLRSQLKTGIEASEQLAQDGDLVRLGLESSAIRELETAQVSRPEIQALVTIDQVPEALALAANCPLREDRLHLLGVIARCLKEAGSPVPEEVLGQIRQLHAQIDPKSLGDKAIDIAADLFPCCPDLAVTLVEQSSWADGDENELDVAYLRLSMAAALHRQDKTDHDDIETIRQRIRDPMLRGFTAALSGRVQSAAGVIAEVDSLETASEKLYLLREWVIEHAEREDAIDVSEYGVTTILGATGYAPNARVLRELSTPLAHAKDPSKAATLVGVFEGQRSAVQEQGPTEEVVRLQLNLAVAESLYDEEACANRLVGVCLLLEDLTDLSTRSSCLAWLLSTLQLVDTEGRIEEREGIGALAREQLEASIDALLQHTAEQVGVTRRIIGSLASYDVDRGIALARSLNTATRREAALLLALEVALETGTDRIDFKSLRQACEGLQGTASRDRAAAAVAEHLAERQAEGEAAVVKEGFELFEDLLYSVSDPTERCRVLCLLCVLPGKGPEPADELRLRLAKKIERSIHDLEPGCERIDTSLRVARSLAEWSPEKARQYLEEAEAERNRTPFSSASSEWTYEACLRLAFRAFAGQLGSGFDAAVDLARLGHLVERLPGTSVRARLWGELAMHLFLRHQSDDANGIVREHVIPLIDSMPLSPLKAATIIGLAPALYQHHSRTALEQFDTLEAYQRDTALLTCAKFILQKHIPSDPFEAHEMGYSLSYEEALDVIEIGDQISGDSMVYLLILALADTLTSTRYKDRFSRGQKVELVRQIKALAGSKFPDPNNIQHDGFALAAKAQVLRIDKRAGGSWQDVARDARLVPNRSDRAYVLAMIGQALPSSQRELSRVLCEEAIDTATTIPCAYDRLRRLADLASLMSLKWQGLARRCLTEAIRGVKSEEGEADPHLFRSVVDAAFKIDEDFAASLVSLLDDDPARVVSRHEMERRLETQRAKRAIIDKQGSWTEGQPELPRAAWLALGSLNAGRATRASMAQLRPALRAAGEYPLSDGFAILAWVVENAVRRFGGTTQSRSTVRVIFEGAVQATELAEIAATTASRTARRVAPTVATPPSEDSMVVKAGERERAEDFLRNWLRRSVPEYVYICDQYFGPDELDLLMLIQSVHPGPKIAVLTSRLYQKQCKVASVYEDYRAGWRSISDQRPPTAEIVVVGSEETGKSPIHDRGILTDQGGVSLGTSWNSLGRAQDSVLRVLSRQEASELCERVGLYLINRRREYGGDTLSYEAVTL